MSVNTRLQSISLSSFLLYNREPILPIDVKYKLSSKENSDPNEPFDKDIFDAVLASSNIIREKVDKQTGEKAMWLWKP